MSLFPKIAQYLRNHQIWSMCDQSISPFEKLIRKWVCEYLLSLTLAKGLKKQIWRWMCEYFIVSPTCQRLTEEVIVDWNDGFEKLIRKKWFLKTDSKKLDLTNWFKDGCVNIHYLTHFPKVIGGSDRGLECRFWNTDSKKMDLKNWFKDGCVNIYCLTQSLPKVKTEEVIVDWNVGVSVNVSFNFDVSLSP